MHAIVTNSLTKIYETVPSSTRSHVRGMKEEGPGLWIKNALKLKSQKIRTIAAVNSLSFSVEVGEVFGVIGPNGAGKTTLVKLLSGLLYPTSGDAKILGLDLVNDHEKIKDKIAYVSTSGWMGLEWQLSAYENLLFYADLLRIPRKVSKVKIAEVTASLGMEKYMKKTIPQLSAGMRQMLTIARGFIADRLIIYLDEPTTSLDPFARKRVWNFILKHNRDHTVIFSSHDPKEIEGYADRVMIVKNGKRLAISKPEAFLRDFSTSQIYEAELSNVNAFNWGEAVEIINALLITDKRIKMRFSLNGSLNDFITALLSKNVVIHNITRSSPNISDAYMKVIKDE